MAASSPRTWGCFYGRLVRCRADGVFPTHVGVFPAPRRPAPFFCRLPHARGGVSIQGLTARVADKSSPRTWGCFPSLPAWPHFRYVFPTHVGVFPESGHRFSLPGSLPHARGGVSVVAGFLGGLGVSSPRTWGCFRPQSCPTADLAVFPTHVGVFLRMDKKYFGKYRLPHARGGVSLIVLSVLPLPGSSPRTWGCFAKAANLGAVVPSSPRTWGCFQKDSHYWLVDSVFPTHVGVFLLRLLCLFVLYGLPHARGGVSHRAQRVQGQGGSSPRTWGCFYLFARYDRDRHVFPTHVGVFLCLFISHVDYRRLPHARGGVSTGCTVPPSFVWSSPRTWGCFSGPQGTARKDF